MRRLTAAAVLVFVLSACGGDDGGPDADFVSWADSEGGLDRATAECVAERLTDDQRDALVSIEADTPESDIDTDAVDAMISASVECDSDAPRTFDTVGDELPN